MLTSPSALFENKLPDSYFSLTPVSICQTFVSVIHSPRDGGHDPERCQSYELLLQQQLYWGQWVWEPSRVKIFNDAGKNRNCIITHHVEKLL